MHSYERGLSNESWDVFFDSGHPDSREVIKTVNTESDAALLVNYLNGGDPISEVRLRAIFKM